MKKLDDYINEINSKTCIDGRPLTEIIAKKDMIFSKICTYKYIFMQIAKLLMKKIKMKASISVSECQDEIDKMSKELRVLDNRL